MPLAPPRRLAASNFTALKAEMIRASVELSDDQLMELTDTLHSMIRLRRPSRNAPRFTGRLEEESPYIV